MKSIIHYPDKNSLRRVIEHPQTVRHSKSRTYVMHTDGTIYCVGEAVEGQYPILYQIDRDSTDFRTVYKLFAQ